MGLSAASPTITISHIRSHDKKKKKKKRLSIYLNSKGRHEESNVKILIVQPFKKLLDIGNAAPSRVVSTSIMECGASMNSRGSGDLRSNKSSKLQVSRSRKEIAGL